ncbi:unnamed protein product [Kuraishia capsulata CBS 1993]|uniref:B-related factor 1 n=1 Tax=Kuraishia capsulata CBS 1993 TaxID=1382522 RepID=W6MS50_9ASCO|nr:uncharacterized protein KUCA_T00005506001 [Kuraishia capsulata CBS 1993]CDK29514.1 unnamed protein product [Kuraishia capsulata CBS 1993]
MATTSSLKCSSCGNNTFTRDIHTSSSDLSCTVCGVVLEENPIVSEVTFGETASGAATVTGAFVGSDQARANFSGNRNALESREQTLSNGKRKIKNVALALRIPDYISDSAYSWFQLALAQNFVRGRRSQNVIAACLYIACRKEKTHHMLIDFSSRLQVSVFAVGATFLRLVKTLHIHDLPLADPSLFIEHFAEKLDFGDLKSKVVIDATKLSHRMAKDWINEGRRPAGIAGACLLLAARMNNFRRTHSEIVAVTRVGEITIQRRLNEFKSTKAGTLTVNEFREADRIEGSLPPSFVRSRQKEDVMRMKYKKYQESETFENGDSDLLKSVLKDGVLAENEVSEYLKRILEKQREHLSRQLKSVPVLEINYKSKEIDPIMRMIDENRPKNLAGSLPKTQDLLAKVSSGPIGPDDMDEDEMASMLLSDEESKLKERVWVGLNQDFLIEAENKRLKQEADRVAGHNQPAKRRRRYKTENVDPDLAELASNDPTKMGLNAAVTELGEEMSAAQSTRSMLQRKPFSKKINYDAVMLMFPEEENQ